MLFGLAISDLATSWPLLAGIPESLSVLLFGIGLISSAGILRVVLARRDEGKSKG